MARYSDPWHRLGTRNDLASGFHLAVRSATAGPAFLRQSLILRTFARIHKARAGQRLRTDARPRRRPVVASLPAGWRDATPPQWPICSTAARKRNRRPRQGDVRGFARFCHEGRESLLTVFGDPLAMTFPGLGHSMGERREITIVFRDATRNPDHQRTTRSADNAPGRALRRSVRFPATRNGTASLPSTAIDSGYRYTLLNAPAEGSGREGNMVRRHLLYSYDV